MVLPILLMKSYLEIMHLFFNRIRIHLKWYFVNNSVIHLQYYTHDTKTFWPSKDSLINISEIPGCWVISATKQVKSNIRICAFLIKDRIHAFSSLFLNYLLKIILQVPPGLLNFLIIPLTIVKGKVWCIENFSWFNIHPQYCWRRA